MSSVKHTIGLVIYPDMTQLDITGPHQVFSMMPDTQVLLLWKNLEPVVSNGLAILPTTTFAECPQLDVLCVPGGAMGTVEMMQDAEMLEFLQKQAQTTKYVTAVCTGSLILAAAGLLQGYRAACHWAFREQLASMGVEVSHERVVIDRDGRITGGGVTAGIDFALTIAAVLRGEDTAKFLELLLEYNPAPPFGVGSPEKADSQLKKAVLDMGKPLIAAADAASQQAAARFR
ncbi:glutamine amidotransferase [Nostoc sp. CENA543]|uniref:DJ-1/PfpI family protein n=1 Tax=Nostoc sp. CENA543 TaxID=1869241 RepID=UPI000CA273CF|nr:DJ-1/PfpI family protein [Nostoc sp. CENA543]AUS99985.1 glutamine amidotransferase [Nostoc sp. CENA543]